MGEVVHIVSDEKWELWANDFALIKTFISAWCPLWNWVIKTHYEKSCLTRVSTLDQLPAAPLGLFNHFSSQLAFHLLHYFKEIRSVLKKYHIHNYLHTLLFFKVMNEWTFYIYRVGIYGLVIYHLNFLHQMSFCQLT